MTTTEPPEIEKISDYEMHCKITRALRYKETRAGELPRSIEDQISTLQDAFARLALASGLNSGDIQNILDQL